MVGYQFYYLDVFIKVNTETAFLWERALSGKPFLKSIYFSFIYL